MARRKNAPDSVRTKCSLAERLRTIRAELFGERGGPELARRLGLPIRTWYNYESGVTVPAEVVLKFVELTAVEPLWLLHGQGPKFRSSPPRPGRQGEQPDSVQALLRTALERLERRGARLATPLSEVEERETRPAAPDGAWMTARSEGRCIRVEGDAMAPIVSDGAEVAFAGADEDPAGLDERLVVAWIDGRPLVRWLQRSGHFAMLRAENPGPDASTHLIDLDDPARDVRIRRVLWIGTRH